MRLIKTSIILLIAVLIMASCTPTEMTPTVLAGIPLPANTAILMETSTPMALPNYDEGQKLVRELLESNAGCQLPCWWGITPSETTWEEARQILERVSSYVGEPNTNKGFDASVQVFLPYPYDFAKYMEHRYGVKDGIVEYIRIYNFNLAPNYYLSKFLEDYGEPTEIWVRTFNKADMDLQPFLIDLFYQDKGILIEYSTGNPLEEVNGKIQNCLLNDMDSPFIHLWSPSDNRSFQEVKIFIDTTSLPEPLPLLDATGMDVKTFYETFKNPDTDVCLETPKNLWP